MVAETSGRYRTSPAPGSRVPGSAARSTGKYGSTYHTYPSDDGTHSSAGVSTAPVFGRIRVTTSVERDAMGGGLEAGSGSYVGSGRIGHAVGASSHGRRFSLSTDTAYSRDRPHNLPIAGGARTSLQLSTSASTSYVPPRRYSVTSTTIRSDVTPSKHLYTTGEADGYGSSQVDGIYSADSSYSDRQYRSTSTVSSRRHARASSVSNYDGGHVSSVREPSISLGEIPVGRSPSVSRYETYNAIGRGSSVTRYDSQTSLGRSPSVSGFDTSVREPSLPRYSSQTHLSRAPSVPRYESQPSTFVRSASVSRYDGPGGRRFRSASVSRFERPTSTGLAASTEFEPEYRSPRAASVARSELTYEHLTTPIDSFAVEDDSSYELRRQLRALRNQQIRAGSVAQHERPEHVIRHVPEAPHVVTRPRSLSTSSPRDAKRRYKVATTIHTVSNISSPANPPIITGYPEPTLYSAKVFRSQSGTSLNTPEDADIAGKVHQTSGVGVSDKEMAFIDSKEDITSFVLQPGEKFLPTDVSVSILPSGKKAVTYTRFSQTGHGDQRSANEEIERIIRKTKHLQDSMHTLEDFVKRNRSLFPEDIIIYQKIIFYLLDEAELIRMGERPDAEVYGVKIRERLIAPIGTDVASILKRFYARHREVDVQYEHPDLIREHLRMTDEGKDVQIPPRRPRISEDLDLERSVPAPRGWVPPSRSRSKEYALHIDEDELLQRDRGGSSTRLQRPCAPEFTHRLRRQRALIGQSVRLSCSVSANPDAVVTWYRAKQEITANGRFTMKNISGLCTLTISDVCAEDGVLYTARAANSEGEATTSALLEVYDLRESATMQALRKRSSEPLAGVGPGPGAAGRRPFFLLEARNLWADEGERAVFEVQAAGKPLPSFTWVRDDGPVVEDDHLQVVCDGYGNCKLVIREIRGADFGTYRCQAQNEDGLVESIASLFCVGNESVRPGEALRNELRSSAGQHKGRQPQFTHVPPSRIDVVEGQPLTLQCAVDGDPKPLVTWYKGVRELTYTGRHRVLEERNNCYLMQIKSTLGTDSGEYTVTAHNLCGLVEFVVYVNVLPQEQTTEDFDPNWKRPDLTPFEYELVTKTKQGKMPPIFVKKLPREKQMKVGASLKLHCYVEESKPREYLVDVDVVKREGKKEHPLPDAAELLRQLRSLDTKDRTEDKQASVIVNGFARSQSPEKAIQEPQPWRCTYPIRGDPHVVKAESPILDLEKPELPTSELEKSELPTSELQKSELPTSELEKPELPTSELEKLELPTSELEKEELPTLESKTASPELDATPLSVDPGIVELAENLAQEISQSAVEILRQQDSVEHLVDEKTETDAATEPEAAREAEVTVEQAASDSVTLETKDAEAVDAVSTEAKTDEAKSPQEDEEETRKSVDEDDEEAASSESKLSSSEEDEEDDE